MGAGVIMVMVTGVEASEAGIREVRAVRGHHLTQLRTVEAEQRQQGVITMAWNGAVRKINKRQILYIP